MPLSKQNSDPAGHSSAEEAAKRKLFCASIAATLFLFALPAHADCPRSSTGQTLPIGKEGAMSYDRTGKQVCWCDSLAWNCKGGSNNNGTTGGGNSGTGTTTAPVSVCMEAEDPTGVPSGSTQAQGNASGGYVRGAYGNQTEGTTFTFTVGAAGVYTLTLTEESAEGAIGEIKVNGGAIQTAGSFQTSTTNWTTLADRVFTINLNAGSNSLRVQGPAGGGAWLLDKFCVVKN